MIGSDPSPSGERWFGSLTGSANLRDDADDVLGDRQIQRRANYWKGQLLRRARLIGKRDRVAGRYACRRVRVSAQSHQRKRARKRPARDARVDGRYLIDYLQPVFIA